VFDDVSVDHSRVKLIPLDDTEDGSDYINASYIPVSLSTYLSYDTVPSTQTFVHCESVYGQLVDTESLATRSCYASSEATTLAADPGSCTV